MIKIGGREYETRSILIPIRYRLRALYMEHQDQAENLFAVGGLILAMAIPSIVEESLRDRRKIIRGGDYIDLGERAADHLLTNGASISEIFDVATKHLLKILNELPNQEELEEAENFSTERTEPCTVSSSDAA